MRNVGALQQRVKFRVYHSEVQSPSVTQAEFLEEQFLKKVLSRTPKGVHVVHTHAILRTCVRIVYIMYEYSYTHAHLKLISMSTKIDLVQPFTNAILLGKKTDHSLERIYSVSSQHLRGTVTTPGFT